MNGAREYAKLFTTGQLGRLYIVSGSHARGRTFHIYVLPEGEEAIWTSENNPPRNKDAVEVYGIVGGQPGWTECYGWLYDGPWREDFECLVIERTKALEAKKLAEDKEVGAAHDAEKRRVEALLSTYK